jgi:hypothetical protein
LWHRLHRHAHAWDEEHDRVIDNLLSIGVDGLHFGHVSRIVAALAAGSRHPYSRLNSDSGQTWRNALPMIWLRAIDPKTRLSVESVRLSPITK